MPHHVPGRALTLALGVAGGLVTGAAFPDLGWWWAAPVGIALLALALRRDDVPWGVLVSFTWGLAFFLPHIHWLNVSVGAVPWIALSVTEAAFVGGFGALWVWSRRASWLQGRVALPAVVFASAWVVVEQARSIWPFGGFPWGRLAFSQAESPALALAALGGAPLVSGAIAGAGGLLALALEPGSRRPGRTLGCIAAAAAFVGAGILVPLPASTPTDLQGSDHASLRVAAVQGNVSEPGLGAFDRQLEVLRNHVDGTTALLDEVAAGDLDLVLWPENAADLDPRVDPNARALVDAAVDAIGAPILVGTLRYDSEGRYNESVLWTPAEGPVAVYTKQHPAPFAEYIPIRTVARVFSDKVDLVQTDMLPGTAVGVIPVTVDRLARTVHLADVICFEVAYDGLVRDAVLGGGEIIVVQTNNASFGLTPESTQQLAMTRLRAVEHGRTAIQISTVGVSGVVAPDGTVVAQTGLFTADQMTAAVPLRTELTPADRIGDAPAWLAAAIAAVALAAGIAAARRRRAGTPAQEHVRTGVEG